jgi:hypothetical protein
MMMLKNCELIYDEHNWLKIHFRHIFEEIDTSLLAEPSMNWTFVSSEFSTTNTGCPKNNEHRHAWCFQPDSFTTSGISIATRPGSKDVKAIEPLLDPLHCGLSRHNDRAGSHQTGATNFRQTFDRWRPFCPRSPSKIGRLLLAAAACARQARPQRRMLLGEVSRFRMSRANPECRWGVANCVSSHDFRGYVWPFLDSLLCFNRCSALKIVQFEVGLTLPDRRPEKCAIHRRILAQGGTRKSAAKELGSVLDWEWVLDYVDKPVDRVMVRAGPRTPTKGQANYFSWEINDHNFL